MRKSRYKCVQIEFTVKECYYNVTCEEVDIEIFDILQGRQLISDTATSFKSNIQRLRHVNVLNAGKTRDNMVV